MQRIETTPPPDAITRVLALAARKHRARLATTKNKSASAKVYEADALAQNAEPQAKAEVLHEQFSKEF